MRVIPLAGTGSESSRAGYSWVVHLALPIALLCGSGLLAKPVGGNQSVALQAGATGTYPPTHREHVGDISGELVDGDLCPDLGDSDEVLVSNSVDDPSRGRAIGGKKHMIAIPQELRDLMYLHAAYDRIGPSFG